MIGLYISRWDSYFVRAISLSVATNSQYRSADILLHDFPQRITPRNVYVQKNEINDTEIKQFRRPTASIHGVIA